MTDELSRLFEAERAVRAPTGGMERGLSRLLTDMGKHVAPLPVATGSLKLGLSVVSKWLIVGFVAGVGGAGAASQIWAPSAAAAPSSSTRPAAIVVAAVSRSATQEAVAEVAAVPAVTTEPEKAASSVRPRPAPSVPSVADATTFDAELRLIAAAKSELEQGRPHLAAGWLSEHAQRFPNGVFRVDREALRVLASCQQKRDVSVARRFMEEHPSSAMVARLLRACSPVTSGPSNAEFSKGDK